VEIKWPRPQGMQSGPLVRDDGAVLCTGAAPATIFGRETLMTDYRRVSPRNGRWCVP
jgi:hypothetical protein